VPKNWGLANNRGALWNSFLVRKDGNDYFFYFYNFFEKFFPGHFYTEAHYDKVGCKDELGSIKYFLEQPGVKNDSGDVKIDDF
jgi:ABC-type microcin C transport system permease subunit YejE